VSEDAVWAIWAAAAVFAVSALAASGLPATKPNASMARAATAPVVPSNIALFMILDPFFACSVHLGCRARPEGSFDFA
jgi:hypothetical protein